MPATTPVGTVASAARSATCGETGGALAAASPSAASISARGLPGRSRSSPASRPRPRERLAEQLGRRAACVSMATGYDAVAIGSAPARAASIATASAVPPGPCA